MKAIEVRPDDKGEFDELVAKNATVHLEMMSDRMLWLCVEVGQERIAVWVESKKPLSISTEDQSEILASHSKEGGQG